MSEFGYLGQERAYLIVSKLEYTQCLECLPVQLRNIYRGLKLFILVGWDRSSSSAAWSTGAQLMIFFCFIFPVVLFDKPGISIFYALYLLSPHLCFFIVLRRDLYVYRDNSLTC